MSDKVRCSFCGVAADDPGTVLLVKATVGPAAICDRCAFVAADQVVEYLREKALRLNNGAMR